MKTNFYFIAIFSLIFATLNAQNISYPAGPAVKNLKTDYGAVGDGLADDTSALNTALNSGFFGIIFIPNGTYKITNTVSKPTQGLGAFFHGESKDGVIIKLPDGTTGFGNPSSPKPFISTCEATGGISADVFYFQWKDFTIDVGNNPGAIAVRFYSNNVGSMTDINIKATNALIGLDMGYRDQNGPNLISKVEISGFQTGYFTTNILNSQTLSEITIRDCNIGVNAIGQNVSIEDLTTINVIEPVRAGAILTLINSNFIGGNGSGPAINFTGGQLFLRNANASGYSNMVGGSRTLPGNFIEEWTPSSTLFNFEDYKPTSLNLPIQKAPDFPLDPDLNNWVSVNSFGVAPNGGNVSSAFQQAIDAAAAAGKTTVYFNSSNGPEPNWYFVDSDVTIHGSVRHIIGLGFTRFVSNNQVIPKLIIGENAAPVIKIENMYRLGGNGFNIVNNSTSTLIVEHVDGAPINVTGPAEVYINDFSSVLSVSNPGARVWARQFNPENGGVDHINVQGGNLWILGLKTERSRPIKVFDGGSLEILGAHIYNTCNSPTNPLFEVTDASASFACIREIVFCGGTEYRTHVRETRLGVTRDKLIFTPQGFRQWDLFSAVKNTVLDNPEPDNVPELNDVLILYPNPSNLSTTLSYRINEEKSVRISVIDLFGNEVRIMSDQIRPQGTYQEVINTEGLKKGIYFVKINESTVKIIKN